MPERHVRVSRARARARSRRCGHAAPRRHRSAEHSRRRRDAEVTKVSINAYGHGLRDRYMLLRAGGAAGFGVGPIIVATSTARGRRTHRDSRRAHDRGVVVAAARPLRHGRDAVRSDRRCGAARRCRLRRADSRRPIHLSGQGPDAARRSRQRLGAADALPAAAGGDRDPARPRAARWRRRSIARFAPASSMRSRIPTPAATTSPRTRRRWIPTSRARHIQLYVNDYTLALDEAAVRRMLEWGEREGVFPRADPDLPLFV